MHGFMNIKASRSSVRTTTKTTNASSHARTSVAILHICVEKASLSSEHPIIGGVQHDINFISDDNAYN